MNEHSFIIEGKGKPFKRQRVGDGIHLILAKHGDTNVSHSFTFDAEKYTVAEATEYLDKIGSEYKQVKASRPLDGKVWGAGLHHVWVNNKPAKVYVPETTIIETFNQMKDKITAEGSIKLGIDHLSDEILADNDILRKLNLLDVGEVNSITTDGSGIYIRESNITNDAIRGLHEAGELPAYSIVGGMDAKPCPTGKADYVVNHIDVERIDVVGEGGCESCKVGVQPSNIILTAKLSNDGEDNMVDANEAPVQETEEVKDDAVVEEEVEVKEEAPAEEEKDGEVQEEVEEEEVVVEEEEPDMVAELKDEIASLKEELKELGGKKPKVAAKSSEAEDAVKDLIKAGKALPKMKEALIATYEADPEAFSKLAASMPKMVTMETKAKLAKVREEDRKDREVKESEEEMKDLAKRYFKVDL